MKFDDDDIKTLENTFARAMVRAARTLAKEGIGFKEAPPMLAVSDGVLAGIVESITQLRGEIEEIRKQPVPLPDDLVATMRALRERGAAPAPEPAPAPLPEVVPEPAPVSEPVAPYWPQQPEPVAPPLAPKPVEPPSPQPPPPEPHKPAWQPFEITPEDVANAIARPPEPAVEPPRPAPRPPQPKPEQKRRAKTRKITEIAKTVGSRPQGYITVQDAVELIDMAGPSAQATISHWMWHDHLPTVVVAGVKPPTKGLPGRVMVEKAAVVEFENRRKNTQRSRRWSESQQQEAAG